MEYPRTRETVSVRGQVLRGARGAGWYPLGAGPGLPAVTSCVCGPGLRLDLSPLRHASWSLGLQPGLLASCPVTAHCDLGPGPRGCGDHREGHWLTIITRSLGFVHGRGCGLWGSSFLPRGPISQEFSKCLGSRISNPVPCPSSLALPGTSSKSLNFQNLQAFPNFSFPSSSYSIVVICLSLVVHLERTQPFKCLSFFYSQ